MSSSVVCDIVIPIWNQQELTRRCLESILRCTEEPIRLILIDNGSEDPARRYLDQFLSDYPAKVLLIRNEANQGYIQGVNQGIRAAQAPWVCLLNNDTIVTAGWLTEMLKVAAADPRIGLVNPTSNSLGFNKSCGEISLEEYAKSLQSESGQTSELSTALGFCLLARRSVFDRVGLLDESFGMGYFEDDDLSRRAKAAGLRCVRACGAYVFHKERGSFRHLAGTKEAFEKNRQAFEKRWGRRLRILWVLPPSHSNPAAFKELAAELAGQGHWIYVLASDGQSSEIPSHSQVAFLKTSEPFWRLQATFRLLVRRKKPFDLVISPDPTWARWVRNLRRLHRAAILESPNTEQVVQECQQLAETATP